MGLTRKRDLTLAVVVTGLLGYLLVRAVYRYFPPLTLWTGVSLLGLAAVIGGWGFLVRARIRDGEIGVGGGRLHPLAVARSVVIAKASAWMGSVVLGWWLAVVVYLLPRRSELRVAAEDTPGAVVAALCALALIVAGLWLQHCCRSPDDPAEDADPAPN
ncbi:MULTISPECIES: DUF3180 domain-containing protein [Mycolicibacterium]|jgi:nitric oxide reductase large subunit|uniref:Membrane protein n=2 Tax=Mycolicibacterium poriferae TaxID=39694 RepID=A0A6N4V0C5_9MYCO|nr:MULTISPECIES: DUF3180 domain-containing protein [Mycolicibacterium]QFS93976.1 hypothetical protein FIV07_24730 [Mycobacterium sp. THAF192]MCG7581363.1 DUF3180 domain-containing protein [Mycolicibacterium sp. OfavD-34-C]MCV7266262.1 DUF3180 domain-containing protein [Mycolicibacterium poriferae]BBX48992.1 membrane protein [Mycolicibacterium poriferae]BBX54440.1 membrane protein [Mycolicibacterium poriferae]